ncbi:hypothetical protein CRENPOLYSF2_2070003 [Crenothrix polyspora]|uniref:DUF748 domain-containing protein n=1 Tax=Crenothrix polyspora TaxID=360316 RepID=A0A1R4H531_9GAMM|nr:DUF748 domain-containing protein [Crenothrix polyspora]SJM91141.1 hypothetical protein CRENPOLYSF2_2070003 [Crenothrix polyspora]
MEIPSRASKIIKVFAVILALIAFYGLLGFVVLPKVLTAKLPDIIHQQTGRKAAIAKIAFNPFNLRCRLQGFTMQEKNGSAFVSFDSFATKINAWQSIKLKAVAIEEVTLTKPFVHVARLKNDMFNFADISKSKPEKKKPDSKIFPVNISQIAIIDGKLFWEDHHLDKSVTENITPINLKIDNFTTHADQQSKLGITLALVSGGKLEWKGKIGVNPIASQGQIKLDKIKLPVLLALALPNKPAFDLQGYELFSADYTLNYIKDGLKLTLSKSKLDLLDVKFSKKAPNPIVINVPNFRLAADYTIDQAKNNFKLNTDKLKIAIQDFQYEQTGQATLLLKILDITHEANIAVSMTDKVLQVTTSKDKLDVRELYFQQQGADKKVIKIPAMTQKTDIKLNKTDKGLDISTDKTRLDVRDLLFEQHGDNSLRIEIPVISHEADIQYHQTDKELQITSNKDKLDVRDLHFEERGSNKRTINIPGISHETDIKFSQNDKGLQVTANKARLEVSKLDFKDSGQNKMGLKIPRFSHETDMQFSVADKIWQVAANKTKITSKDIQLSGMDIAPILLKIPEIALETAYKTDNKDNKFNFVASKGKFDLQKLQLDDTDHKTTLAKINAFALSGLGINLNSKELLLESVSAKNADFKAWLNADKTINYQTLFVVPKQATPRRASKLVVASKKTTDTQWKIKVNKLALTDFGLDFEDKSLAKPVTMSARPIDVQLKNFTNKTGASLPLQLSVGINKSGSIKIDGNVTVEPFSTQLTVAVNKIALEKFQPYVDKFARLDIIQGNLNVDGKLSFAKKASDLDVKFKGNTNVADLVTRDQIQNKDFVKWDDVSLKNIDADVLGNRYTVGSLIMNKPYARVTIRKDKTINVNDIMIVDNKTVQAKTKPVSVKATSTTSKKPYFRLNTVKIIDGASDFSDFSLILPFSAPIKGLDGGASGISSEQNSKMTVALEGNAFELSPVKIKGSLSPYLGDFDIDMSFEGMPMPLVSPYMVQFAGYKVEKGKLSLGLKYTIEKKQLTASNNILIDQLELGEKVENPNAVSLPLELAIVLLKDSDGKIKIDVPLTGSLEDPKFSIGNILGDALLNVLTKIITSPFNAIAGLVGSDADLSVINFAAGSDILAPEQMTKLNDIAKALKDRTALNIEIKGAAFQEQDWPILREDALHEQLRRVKANEISKDDSKKIRSEYVYLSADDYNRLLRDVFIQQYPQLAKKSIFGTPTLINNEEADFYAFAKKKLAETLVPDHKRLNDLATERAQTIAKYLAQKAGIPNERIFILDTVVDPERKGKDITSQLSLKTN